MNFIIYFLMVIMLIFIIYMMPRYIRYKGSDYKIASGNSFLKTMYDTGIYGEFLTFSYLEKLKEYHKLMTNLYLPKGDGTTTEIDLIMISEKGIYVFESKNYSGWIFGDENNKNWMQTLPNKQKNKFFNPIWQNKGHINALKSATEIDNDEVYKSYIIFSERCTLKKINVTSPNVKVMKRNELIRALKKDMEISEKILTGEEVDQLYVKLQKYTRVDEEMKKAHVEQIQMKR